LVLGVGLRRYVFCQQPAISMSRVSWLAGTEFAFFARLCPTRGTARQYCRGTFLHRIWRGAVAKLFNLHTPESFSDQILAGPATVINNVPQ
jgi:hypothetical protein